MVAGEWQPHIPAASIGHPRIPDGIVPRLALLQKLRAARGGDLITVTAPGGYGKTTTVASWDEADDRPFAWVRLDHLDDDPVHLLLHIATAVDGVRRVDPALLRYLRGPGRDPITRLVPALIREVERCGSLVLVLDDTHQLSAPAAVKTLHGLIDDSPPSTIVTLVGRSSALVDVARRRLDRSVVEIDTDDLRLADGEAAAAFLALGGPTNQATVSAVVDNCEGWPAGVLLAAMALRDGAPAATFTGRHHLVADYLLEEVLSHLDQATTQFLVESAVFDEFRAEYLDAVLARSDSAVMLESLAKAGNLFLVPLDAEGVWYRYHRLFGDLLRNRLRVGDPGRFTTLANGAADLLEREGDLDGALALAVSAGNGAHAAALVERDAVTLGFDGRAGVLARRLALLDEQTFSEYPDAAIARAWLGVTTADGELIQRSLVQAARADRGRPLSDGTPSVSVAAALVGSLVGVGGVHAVARHADTVRAAGDHLVNPWWGAATVMKGAAEAMLGNSARARLLLESALPVIGNLPGFHAAALAHLALLDLGDGDDVSAVARSAAAREIVDDHDLCDVVPMVVVYAANAVTAARTGDSTRAREAVEATERLLDGLGNLAARTALLGHGLLAWTAAVLDDTDLLGRHLEAAERARRREPDAMALARRVDRVKAMAVGGDRRPLTAAELRLLPHLATHLSLQRIAGELHIGRETVKSQTKSIYRKLGVASRAAAVTEARRVGLLEN